MKAAVAIAFLALNYWVYADFAREEMIPERASFDSFPMEIGEWSCSERQQMPEEALRFLGATDYFLCSYYLGDSPAPVSVYVGYHATQVREHGGVGGENSIHPPEHCLPGSGWNIIDSKLVPLSLPGLPQGHGVRADGPEAKRFVIAKGDARQLVYFWYQSQGSVIARNEDVILNRFWGRATAGRTDGSLVRLTVPILRGNEEAAEALFHDFASLLTPRLEGYLPE